MSETQNPHVPTPENQRHADAVASILTARAADPLPPIPPVDPKTKKNYQANEGSFGEFSEKCIHHFLMAPINAKPEDILDPAFWSNVVRRVNEGDEITVVGFDRTWKTKVVVRQKFSSGLHVAVDQNKGADFYPIYYSREEHHRATEEEKKYLVQLGPNHKYRVLRIADGHIVGEHYIDEPSARRGLADYLKSLAL